MNDSGYRDGVYASPEDSAEYRRLMEGYLDRRNAAWLDRWTDPKTGEVRKGVKDLCNPWQLDGHAVKWAIANGLLDRRSIKPDGLQHRQIGRLSAIVYFRSARHHRDLAFELARYLDERESQQLAKLED